jgi:hypothetical protein
MGMGEKMMNLYEPPPEILWEVLTRAKGAGGLLLRVMKEEED